MTRPLLLFALALAFAPGPARAQELPFTVSIIDWDADVKEGQRRAYRGEAGEHEVLYCIESWKADSIGPGLETIVITAVRRERPGTAHRIHDVGENCKGADGKSLPMFHTHSDGNCQFSPSDLITVVARAAPFEGVQCGERHFIWTFAWQIVAIANSVERERMARGKISP